MQKNKHSQARLYSHDSNVLSFRTWSQSLRRIHLISHEINIIIADVHLPTNTFISIYCISATSAIILFAKTHVCTISLCVCLSLSHTHKLATSMYNFLTFSYPCNELRHLLSSFCSLTPFLHMANKHTHKRNVIITVNIAVPSTYSVCRLPLPKKNKMHVAIVMHVRQFIYIAYWCARRSSLSLCLFGSFWLWFTFTYTIQQQACYLLTYEHAHKLSIRATFAHMYTI